jgi:hypothetical protein
VNTFERTTKIETDLLCTFSAEELRAMWRKLRASDPESYLITLIEQVGHGLTHPLGVRTEGVDHESLEAFVNRPRPQLGRLAVKVAAPTAPAPAVKIPAGRYAVETNAGHLAFYKVDTPTEGRWAGYTFVTQQTGDTETPIKARNMREGILAQIAVDVQGAMERYGREIGSCGHCGRTLTNEESRERGIGPVCADKMGW